MECMIDVRIGEESLDLNEDTTLAYTVNNSVFTSSDTSQLPGSYSFPFTVPATTKNRRIFKNPGLITSAQRFVTATADIYFAGVLIFPAGTITLESADEKSISLYVVAAQIADLKSIKLSEMDLEGVRSLGTPTATLLHAKLTAENPLDWDYIFFPVLNQTFIATKSSPIFYWFQNYYNSATQEFVADDDKPVFMPFVRITYLLERIFLQTGYSFKNEFQDTDELKQLVLYNNKSMYSQEGLQDYILLNDHVPETTCTDFIKKLSSVFCLGIFTDTFSRTIRLIPLKKILQRPHQLDWTYKAHKEYKIEPGGDAPSAFCYAEDDRDGIFKWLKTLIKPAVYTTVQTFAEIFAAFGYYYVIARHSYWQHDIRTRMVYTTFGCMPEDVDVKKREAAQNLVKVEFQPLMDVHGYSIIAPHTYVQLPRIDQPGTVEYIDAIDPETGDDIWKEQRNDCPERFTIYRGMIEDPSGNLYPLASGIPYDSSSNPVGEVSLRWDGEDGVYNTWWRDWHEILRAGKPVTRSFNLTPADLVEFSFDKKVRVDNMDYFIKSIRVTLTMQRMMPVEVQMISVI